MKCNDLAACVAAFLTYYAHDIMDKYLELKRELVHCFRTTLVSGPLIAQTDGGKQLAIEVIGDALEKLADGKALQVLKTKVHHFVAPLTV